MREPTTLGERVAYLRNRQGLIQKELAERAEVSTPFVSEIENDKRNVSSTVLHRIAKVLGASLDYLMAGEGDQPQEGDQLQKGPTLRKIPSELEIVAGKEGWSFVDTIDILEATQMVLARPGGRQERRKRNVQDLSRKDWKNLYKSLIEPDTE